jgi:hypothetical protein
VCRRRVVKGFDVASRERHDAVRALNDSILALVA